MTSLAIGLCHNAAPASAEPPPLANPPQLTPLDNGTFELVFEDDQVTITVTAPAVYAGTYMVAAGDLLLGPVLLRPPELAGAPEIGAALSVLHSGLWAYSDDAVSISLQWYRDDLPLPNATESNYTLVAEDAGASITLRETAQDGFGQRSAPSDAVVVPVSSSFEVAFIDHGSVNLATPSTTYTVPGVQLGDPSPNREIFVVAGLLFGPTNDLADILSVSIGGQAAQVVAASDPANGPVEIWKVPLTDGTVGDVEVETSSPCFSMGIAVYRAVDAEVTQIRSDTVTGGTMLDLSLDTQAGAIVIAGAKSANSGPLTATGFTQDHNIDLRTSDHFIAGRASIASGETPRTMQITAQAAGNAGGVSIQLEARQ